MSEIIYGVDKTSNFSPKDVLSAIENCFLDAHREVVDSFFSGKGEVISEEDKENIRKMDIRYLIKNILEKGGGNYENPTKENLLYLIYHLKEFAKNFRNSEIIEKHYSEIMGLINVLK